MIAQSLWLNESLTTMEHTCIQSFLNQGYDFHLYTYGEVEHVPTSAQILDANEILHTSQIPNILAEEYPNFYEGKRSPLFADIFRIALMRKKGGLWVDCDTYCIRPFPCDTSDMPYMFARSGEAGCIYELANAPLYIAKPQDPLADALWSVACNTPKIPEFIGSDTLDEAYGTLGVKLLTYMVDHFKLREYIRPQEEFFPITYDKWDEFIEDNNSTERDFPSAYSFHFWNQKWIEAKKDKNGVYFNSLYEDLIERTQCRTGDTHLAPTAMDIKQYAHDERPKGWFTDADSELYIKAIEEMDDGGSIVEVGSFQGRSLSYIMPTAIEKKCMVYCVDPWNTLPEDLKYPGRQTKMKFEHNMRKRGYLDHIWPMEGFSHEVVSEFPNKSLDVVYLDGSHAYEDVCLDIKEWWEKLKPGGMLLGHDFGMPEVWLAVVHSFTVPDQVIGSTWSVRKSPDRIGNMTTDKTDFIRLFRKMIIKKEAHTPEDLQRWEDLTMNHILNTYINFPPPWI